MATGLAIMTANTLIGGSMKSGHHKKWMVGNEKPNQWVVVNDDVMGGVSQSRVDLTKEQTVRFSGAVSLENNGGFASIRHNGPPAEIRHGDGVRLRVLGDGKTYQFRVRTAGGTAYKADFTTIRGTWQEFGIPWSSFEATYRGRAVKGAPPLKGDAIRQVGFLIANGKAETFDLQIESMEPFHHTTPNL
jgi:monofunctional biosynthetic peptidoglycan transglycosylase